MSDFEARMKTMQRSSETWLPLKSYTVLQLDGKAFHTFTRSMGKPFDLEFMQSMDEVLLSLCRQVGNVKFGYVQSDELSLLLTDFETAQTGMIFNGRVQKIVSTTAGLASAVMARLYPESDVLPVFDARVFNVPSRKRVLEWFHWRQTDCVKNSVSAAAQAVFAPEELHGKHTGQAQGMLKVAGKPWEMLPDGFKYGRAAVRTVDGNGRSCWQVGALQGMLTDVLLPHVDVGLTDLLP